MPARPVTGEWLIQADVLAGGNVNMAEEAGPEYWSAIEGIQQQARHSESNQSRCNTVSSSTYLHPREASSLEWNQTS